MTVLDISAWEDAHDTSHDAWDKFRRGEIERLTREQMADYRSATTCTGPERQADGRLPVVCAHGFDAVCTGMHLYDPRPDGDDQTPPEDEYAGTGIGLLYGYPLRGHDPLRLVGDTLGWVITRPHALGQSRREARHFNTVNHLEEVA